MVFSFRVYYITIITIHNNSAAIKNIRSSKTTNIPFVDKRVL